MEVGAVKQAFNNEVIQLKKNLNQAKLQVIHKLTRKAKTLTEKKTPEHLKDKNKKKAESAVKEVLIMKKLKPRDIAKFIITYKGELNNHLNKPTVDSDKACARLLLHKALQPKYKSIKDKFGDIPIKDLLMSRQERRKLKKEAKDAQKNKKKGKEKVVNSEGDWNVEDVKMDDDSKEIVRNDGSDSGNSKQDDDVYNNKKQDNDALSNDGQEVSDDEDDAPLTRQVVNDSDEFSAGEQSSDDDPGSTGGNSDDKNMKEETSSDDVGQDGGTDEEMETENLVTIKQVKQVKLLKTPVPIPKSIQPATAKLKDAPKQMKKPDKKVKENKNKNLNVKMLNRQFKKDNDGSQNIEKVVDPFFKTVTGENYMSVAEPRQPDEVKEYHRQGNRQERRAAMFGRAPIRPRRDDREHFATDKYNGNGPSKFNSHDGNDRRAKFNDRNSFNNRNSNFNDSKFNDRNSKYNNNTKFNDRNSNINDSKFNDKDSNFNDKKNNNNTVTEPKVEKLHPSWEAKKKQSGILPFKGKKIVFDES